MKDENGKVIELVAKSRGKAVADEHILEMYSFIDKKPIFEFYDGYDKECNDVLMFELYGTLNRHEITYMDTYIDVCLIGMFVDGKFLTSNEMLMSPVCSSFARPDLIYRITKGADESEFSVKWIYRHKRLKNYPVIIEDKFPTLYDAIQEVKAALQTINEEYKKYNGRRALEGIVINGEYFMGGQTYIKVKPDDIEKEARNRYGISRRFILKEVRKYFDEYGSDVRQLYDEDENHYFDYVTRQLSEEFTPEQINDPRTGKRIKNIFMDVWDSKVAPVSLQNICEDLIEQNPDAEISELMKIFADRYPTKKKKSRFVFNILSGIKNKMGS